MEKESAQQTLFPEYFCLFLDPDTGEFIGSHRVDAFFRIWMSMNRIADGNGERRFLNRNDRQFFRQDDLRLLVDLCPAA